MSEVKRFRADHRHVVETEFDDAQFVGVADFDRVTAERDAALGREAALKVSLGISANLSELYVEGIESIRAERDALQQRLTAADERVDVLEQEVEQQRSSKEQWEKVAADWVLKSQNADQRIHFLSGLMQEFCDRVERGEARSKTTYAKFKAALGLSEKGQCKTCNGTRIVSDGAMYCSSGGIPFECGPIECVKDCPDCTKP